MLYDATRFESPTLTDVDNVTAHRSGDVFVCENAPPDRDPLDIAIISTEPKRRVGRFLKATGSQHRNLGDSTTFSELTGACFNPRGDRLYFSSQRGAGFGINYEIRGPFR